MRLFKLKGNLILRFIFMENFRLRIVVIFFFIFFRGNGLYGSKNNIG